ncbi:MAG: tripartite tricarboxylate transporter substrate binding protein [Betaproteobacteria bacterium]|nr:tripartite tricarboxylate transporter substrate binding protein [Betaproteobacteria bacterium]
MRVLASILALQFLSPCWAQSFPSKAVRIVVPAGSGSATDVRARWIADKLTPVLGQGVVVENRAGGGGGIGTEAVVRAAPDGYTLALSHQGTIAINPHLYANLGYDTLTDLLHITRISANPVMLATGPSLGVQTLAEFLKIARGKPGQLNYGSPGSGTPPHMASELFNRAAGIQVTHVPFKSGATALTELMAGRLAYTMDSIAVLGPQAKGGKIRAIAVTGTRRLASWPDVPTMAEAGLPGYEYLSWMGISAPAGTPRDLVMKLNTDLRRVLATNDAREWFGAQGAEPGNDTPEEFLAFVRGEHAKWGRVVRESGIKAD